MVVYPFVVKVTYWDDYEEPSALKTIHILLYAESMTAAVARIEDRYVNCIESIKVSECGDETALFEVPAAIAKAILRGEGIYEDGLKKMQGGYRS